MPGTRVEARKDRAEWREGSSFYCPGQSSASPSPYTCVSCTESTVSPILMYLLAQAARWLFIGPVLPPFISHYETSSLEFFEEDPDPLVSLRPGHCTRLSSSRWSRSGLRSLQWGRTLYFFFFFFALGWNCVCLDVASRFDRLCCAEKMGCFSADSSRNFAERVSRWIIGL